MKVVNNRKTKALAALLAAIMSLSALTSGSIAYASDPTGSDPDSNGGSSSSITDTTNPGGGTDTTNPGGGTTPSITTITSVEITEGTVPVLEAGEIGIKYDSCYTVADSANYTRELKIVDGAGTVVTSLEEEKEYFVHVVVTAKTNCEFDSALVVPTGYTEVEGGTATVKTYKKSLGTVPVVGMTDVEKVAAAKNAVQTIIDGLTATNETTKEYIQNLVNASLAGLPDKEGITVVVTIATKTNATITDPGTMVGVAEITCGEATDSVVINKTIAKLPEPDKEPWVLPGWSLDGKGSTIYVVDEFDIEINPTEYEVKYAIVTAGNRLTKASWKTMKDPTLLEFKNKGNWDVYYSITNEEGEMLVSDPVRIYYDVTAPVAPTINTTNNLANKRVLVVISRRDDNGSPIEGIYYRLDGGYWEEYESEIAISTDGEHTVEAYVVDMCGNESKLSTKTFTVSYADLITIPEARVEGSDTSYDSVKFNIYDCSWQYEYYYQFVPSGKAASKDEWNELDIDRYYFGSSSSSGIIGGTPGNLGEGYFTDSDIEYDSDFTSWYFNFKNSSNQSNLPSWYYPVNEDTDDWSMKDFYIWYRQWFFGETYVPSDYFYPNYGGYYPNYNNRVSASVSIEDAGSWDLHIRVVYPDRIEYGKTIKGKEVSGKVGSCIIDREIPVVNNVTKKNTSSKNTIALSVSAKDAISGNKLQYSFDHGKTWQSSNSKTFTAKTTLKIGDIQVKDACGNIAYAPYAYQIDIYSNSASYRQIQAYYTKDNMSLDSFSTTYGYMLGIGDNKFDPDRSINRAELATLLNRVINFSKDSTSYIRYYDVTNSHWAYQNILNVQRYNLIDCNEANFYPSKEVTRAELAHALCQFIDLDGINPAACPLTDIKNSPYKDDIIKLYTTGLMQGYGNNRFGPDDVLTRAQVVTVINRIINMPDSAAQWGVEFDDVPKSHWAYNEIKLASYSEDNSYYFGK